MFTGGCHKQLPREPLNMTTAYEVQDSTGYVVKLVQKPQRIVSLTLGTDEMLLAMVAPQRIKALTYLADDGSISSVAEQAKQVPVKIRDNAETVIALQPDLVLIADWMGQEISQSLRDAGLAVYVYKTPATVAQVKQTVLEISKVVGAEPQGVQIVADMDAELTKVAAKVGSIPAEQRQKVVVLSFMGSFGGKGSLFDDMCNYAGVINGVSAAGLGRNDLLAKEQMVQIDPDLLLLPTWDYDGKHNADNFKASVQSDPALQTVKAVRQQRLVQVPDRYLYCVSQYIVYGVRDVARAAYPQYFERE